MDNSARIAEIRAILQAGARQVTVDGTTVTYDFAALRQELRELMSEDDILRHRKPRISSINLGNS
jgi:threonine aldolase